MIDFKKYSWWEYLLLLWFVFDIITIITRVNTTPEMFGRYTGDVMYKWILIGLGYYIFVYRERNNKQSGDI